MLCKKPLGFGTAIYCYPTRLGHADGLDDAHAKAVNRLIDGLAEFVAKLYFDGKLPDLSSDEGSRIEEPASKRRPKNKRTKPSEATSSEQADSVRYSLPEFDIHVAIPAGRGPRNRKSRRLEQHHHLLWPGDPEPVADLDSEAEHPLPNRSHRPSGRQAIAAPPRRETERSQAGELDGAGSPARITKPRRADVAQTSNKAVPQNVLETMPDDRLFTVAEVSTLLRVRKAEIYAACDRGDLAYVKFEGTVQIEGRDLKLWVPSLLSRTESTPP